MRDAPPIKGWAIVAVIVLCLVAILAVFLGLSVILPDSIDTIERHEAAPRFVVFVRRGPGSLSLTNDTGEDWYNCTVTIAGDYAVTLPALRARATEDLYFEKFRSEGTPLRPDQGYRRSLEQLDLECLGEDGRRHTATLR